jgi:UDP-N-acetylmuramate: L-alanyl-gamma-D-glutamyl-meso-diaminopimelate ligase
VFQHEYEIAFDGASAAFIAEPYGTDGLTPEERFEPSDLVASLRTRGIDAHSSKSADEIVELVKSIARPHDVVLVMSNGGFGGIHEKLLKNL